MIFGRDNLFRFKQIYAMVSDLSISNYRKDILGPCTNAVKETRKRREQTKQKFFLCLSLALEI